MIYISDFLGINAARDRVHFKNKKKQLIYIELLYIKHLFYKKCNLSAKMGLKAAPDNFPRWLFF